MIRPAVPLITGLCLLLLYTVGASAADPRTWTDTTGRTLDGSLVRHDAAKVWVLRADGREVAIDKSRLSAADLDYVKSQPTGSATASSAPAAAPAASSAAKPGQSVFKSIKIDNTAWETSAELFHAGGVAFTQRLQTPHYLILGTSKVKPELLTIYGEAAERMFADCILNLPSLESVLKEKRMAIWLIDSDISHKAFGNWLRTRGSFNPSWESHRIAGATLSEETCDELKVVRDTRAFRTDKFTTNAHRSLDWPNRLHFLVSDLMYAHLAAVGQSEPEPDGSRRSFSTLRLGFSFFKEWQVAGRIDTELSIGGASVEGFQNGRRWADAVRKVLRNPAGRPSLDDLLKTRPEGAQPMDVACAFGMMQFFNADPARFKAFDTLILEAREAKKTPTTEAFAKALGYDSPAAFDEAWIAFMSSPAFK